MTKGPKFQELMEEHKIEVSALPDKVKQKIETFDTVYDEYNDAEENSQAETDAHDRLVALDAGITTDIEAYIKEQRQNPPTPPAPPAPPADPASKKPFDKKTETPPADDDDSSPSWKFW
jgi:hypothetical protein